MSELRQNQASADATNPLLVWAFGISVAAHLLMLGGYELGLKYGLWKTDFRPQWLKLVEQKLDFIQPKKQPPPNQARQQPPQLVFLDVDPEAMTPEPPKDAKYYSSRNSQAANVEATIDTANDPNINGKQTHVPRTQDAKPARSVPLQPTAPPKEAAPEKAQKEPAEEESKPKPKGAQPIGDLAMAKPAEKQPGEGTVEKPDDPGLSLKPVHKRPKTISEAKSHEALAGQKMHENGGVTRHLRFDSLDAKATPFGEYDRQLIEAIQNRWYQLLDEKTFSRDRTGRVVLEFNLNSDGRITDMKVVENTVDELLAYVCQKAVWDPAPFAPWPPDMRRILDTNQRDIRFTFYYE